MKNIPLLLIILFSISIFATLQAQQDCQQQKRLVEEGDNFFAQQKYTQAVNKYQAAMTNCPEKMAVIQPKIKQVFEAIEQLRIKAEQSEAKAKESEAKAKESEKKAKESEKKALALLENIAERELKATLESIYAVDFKGAYIHLQATSAAQKPALKQQQMQYLIVSLYAELYKYPTEEWHTLPSLRCFERVGNQVVINFENKVSAFAPAIAQAKQKKSRQEARRYLLGEIEKAVGKEFVRTASDIWGHTRTAFSGKEE